MAWPHNQKASATASGRAQKRTHLEDDEDEDDAQLLLPTSNGLTHKRIQRVKHSLSYILISGAASFVLVIMVWLGPGLVSHDPKGIATQSNAHVGYSEDTSSTGKPIIPVSANSSSRPKLSVSKLPVERKPIPHHSWNPLIYDPAPITHVYVKPCMFPPWAFKSFCTPHQTAREIALYGRWVRVPRDLSKGVGHYYTEIYYRRAQTLDVSSLDPKPITGLQIVDEDEESDPVIKAKLAKEGWEVAGESLRTGIWPTRVTDAKLYFTRSTSFMNPTDQAAVQPINEISVLWSHKADLTKPWWGFERLNKPVFDGDNLIDHIQCDISVRRQIIEPPPPPALTFQKDGKFKIMQISDLHFSASGGTCQSASELENCAKDGADGTTKKWLTKAIGEARPDLIVLGGDQLLGRDKTFDTISTLTKIGHFFADQKVPWTVVFGNHDVDRSLAIEEQMYLMKQMPFFLGKAGPGVPGFDDEGHPQVDQLSDMGVGNYVLRVNASLADPTQLLSLYFLDSHDYPRKTFSHLWDIAMGGSSKFDWLKKSQIEWYKRQSEAQPRVLQPYEASAGYRARAAAAENAGKKSKPVGLMFFHIPLPEAYAKADLNPKSKAELVFGNQRESPLNAEDGDHFFEKAIRATPISDSHSNATTFEPEIKVIANGHAHATDTCRQHQGVYHCFSGLASYSGTLDAKAARGWERRVRVFEVERFGGKVATYLLKHALDSPGHPVVRLGSHVLFDSESTSS
ncbi:hypothetical protein PTTG_08617 [Puccinia triticina 1-1 BBBD Race 1]|uniref:Metallophos domain-containing protein n=2 Tax=Puccinia triticina TaxID=208348 RepID=A0A180H5I6_PUCT1|nr:hypothetical protein PTTG_08617 [Puccinia triticina 1-1 BBBD Race 1]WAR60255.1 hypothetical protein PtB15_9B192 [Puccinia triticina]